MHPKFLPLLCCPRTKQNLSLEIEQANSQQMVITGKLITEDKREYPIINGIPRFVDKEYYASSFGYEWQRWPRVQFESENEGKPMARHTKRMWQIITDRKEGSITGQTVVEFGCGPGRFLDIVRKQGAIAVGIDLSQAVEVARSNFADDADVLIVQGDLNYPPFKESVFDGGYSIGVLHHTPEPVEGLKALVHSLKPDGWVACCVYAKDSFYDYPSVDRMRKLQNRLQPLFKYYPALFYSYLSAYLLTPAIANAKKIPLIRRFARNIEREFLVVLDLPDVRWRILDIFDAITPAIATTHTGEELTSWLEKANCRDIYPTDWGKTSRVGFKSIK